MFISIVVPFHNEEQNLKLLLPRLFKSVRKLKKIKYEIILVNDFSNDKSLNICKKFIKKKKRFSVINLKKRGGQTGAFREAVIKMRGSYMIRMDSDLQDRPEDLKLFIGKILEGYELVIGNRRERKHSYLLGYCSDIYNKIMKSILNVKINVFTSSFVAFKKPYLKNLPWFYNDHRYLPAILISRGAYKVTEVDIKHLKRKYGNSKYNLIKKIILGIPEVLLFLLRLKFGFYNLKNK